MQADYRPVSGPFGNPLQPKVVVWPRLARVILGCREQTRSGQCHCASVPSLVWPQYYAFLTSFEVLTSRFHAVLHPKGLCHPEGL
jgi:hypothetical protein